MSSFVYSRVGASSILYDVLKLKTLEVEAQEPLELAPAVIVTRPDEGNMGVRWIRDLLKVLTNRALENKGRLRPILFSVAGSLCFHEIMSLKFMQFFYQGIFTSFCIFSLVGAV